MSELQTRLDRDDTFAFIHFDLDNFKAFNDKHGFEQGDSMIHILADTLRESVQACGFVGHIGGDDFVAMLGAEEDGWEGLVNDTLARFSERAAALYDPEERLRGYIESKDRQGVSKRFALATISASAAICMPGRFDSHLEVAEVVAEIKHRSKMVEGNSLVVDRRGVEL